MRITEPLIDDGIVTSKAESLVERTGKMLTYVSRPVKKLMSPEEDDEEAAYDRADDLVRPGEVDPLH